MVGGADWGRPFAIGAGELYLAYQQPTRAYAAPIGIATVRDDGQPGYVVERFRLDDPEAGPQVLALLTARFEGAYDLAARRTAAAGAAPGVTIEALPLAYGFARFDAGPGIDLPDALTQPQPLAWDGPGGLKLSCALTDEGARALEQLMRTGTAPVVATAEVCALGVAARAQGRAQIDPRQLAPCLEAGAPWTRPALVEAAKANTLDGAVLQVLGDTPEVLDKAMAEAATALADRLIGAFGQLTPMEPLGPEVGWRFTFPAGASRLMLDLSAEAAAPRGFVLVSEASTPASALFRDSAVPAAPISLFPTGLNLVTIDPNLPARHTALAVSVQIEAPAHPPERRQTVSAHATFAQGERARAVALRLAPGEPLAFSYRTSVVVATPTGPRQMMSEPRPHSGPILTVPPEAFAARFVRIEAMAGLLALGDVEFHANGIDEAGAQWSASGVLSAAEPVMAVAAPPDVKAVLQARLTRKDELTTIDFPIRQFTDCWLDLTDVPGIGPRAVEIACTFDDTAPLADVEAMAVSQPERVVLVRATRKTPTASFAWFADDPFQPGVKLRWARPDAPWSPVMPADQPIRFASSARTSSPWPGAVAQVESVP